MAKEEEKKTRKSARHIAAELRYETIKTFSTLLTSAFGLVAAFAWNDTVKEAIDRYISPGQGLKSQLLYAILVTILAIIISFQLGKLTQRYKVEEEKEDEN